MRTKWIVGLTVGLITAAQIANAQTQTSRDALDNVFDNSLVNYTDTTSLDTSWTTLASDMPDAGLIATTPDTLSLFETPAFAQAAEVAAPVVGEDFTGSHFEKAMAGRDPVTIIPDVPTPPPIPEPGTMGLLTIGVGAVGAALRRKNRA